MACHVRVIRVWHAEVALVVVLVTTIVTLAPLHASVAVGASKLQVVPHSTVLLAAQLSTGGVVSMTVTAWPHTMWPPQASVASQVLVMTVPTEPTPVFVIVF